VIEIEYIPIGDEVNTGDAILCHFTEPATGTDRVILIDGGFVDTSEQIISHVREFYGRESIDLVVCTHPDDDHINGLSGVIEDFTVDNLLIHRPQDHGFSGDEVKSEKIQELIDLAKSNGTNVVTGAFAGQLYYNDAVMIAGPTKEFYIEQLRAQMGVGAVTKSLSNLFGSAVRAVVAALRPRTDDPGEGTLTDNGGTTPRNNSSIILDIQLDGHRALLTGDAGVPALNAAADVLDTADRVTRFPDFFDVPHHGSRHNLDTATADRLLGPVGGPQRGSAFVSVGKKATDFPRPEVANALKRRGYSVSPTRGQVIRWHRDATARPDWVSLVPLGWFDV
jgi:beta-lactamase superfamily II metal-dependent hydrolase